MNSYSREEMFPVPDTLGLQAAPEFAALDCPLVVFAVLVVLIAINLGIILYKCVNIAQPIIPIGLTRHHLIQSFCNLETLKAC